MQNALNFLPRLTMRGMAQQAYRLAMTHGKFNSVQVVNKVTYEINVDCELDSVFIMFDAPNGDAKVSVHSIQKGW